MKSKNCKPEALVNTNVFTNMKIIYIGNNRLFMKVKGHGQKNKLFFEYLIDVT